jgi:hypothetical protein
VDLWPPQSATQLDEFVHLNPHISNPDTHADAHAHATHAHAHATLYTQHFTHNASQTTHHAQHFTHGVAHTCAHERAHTQSTITISHQTHSESLERNEQTNKNKQTGTRTRAHTFRTRTHERKHKDTRTHTRTYAVTARTHKANNLEICLYFCVCLYIRASISQTQVPLPFQAFVQVSQIKHFKQKGAPTHRPNNWKFTG